MLSAESLIVRLLGRAQLFLFCKAEAERDLMVPRQSGSIMC